MQGNFNCLVLSIIQDAALFCPPYITQGHGLTPPLLVGVGQVAHRRVAAAVVADEKPGQADLGAGDFIPRPFHALFVFPVFCRGRRYLVLLGLR